MAHLSTTTARIRRTRRLGAVLMASSLAVATALTTLAPAAAQEAPAAPDDAQPLEVEASASYSYPVTDALPATLTSEFPPGVVCIVVPEFCPEELQPVGEGVSGAVGSINENEPTAPRTLAPPDSLPTAIQNGARRYESAVKFTLPPLSADQTVDEFTLVLTETQPTFHMSSPAFRQAVLAALTCAREGDGPGGRCEQSQFDKTLEETPAESAVLDIEVCPFTEAFEPGDGQPPPEEHPVDCLYGANAQRLEGTDGIWLVDLTFTAQAWRDGTLENHGVLIRPTGAPNLAYGDPDPTTSAQTTFTQELQYDESTAPATGTGGFGNGTGTTGGGDGTSSSSGDFSADNGGGFSSAPRSGSSGGMSSDPFSPPAPVTADEAEAAPEVAAPDEAGVADPSNPPVAGDQMEPAATGGSAWWQWLLVPIFALGAWMTAQSLSAEAVVSTGALYRNGAMSRLIAKQHEALASADPMTQV